MLHTFNHSVHTTCHEPITAVDEIPADNRVRHVVTLTYCQRLLCSENPTSSSSAVHAECAGVLPAPSLRPLPGPGPGPVDVSPPQTSLRPRGPQRGETAIGCLVPFFHTHTRAQSQYIHIQRCKSAQIC